MQYPPHTKGGRCPPPPPSSPTPGGGRRLDDSYINDIPLPSSRQYDQQQQQLQQRPPSPPQQSDEIADLIQFAQSSYVTNPTDALNALMSALDLTTGTSAASRHAMDRIRSELGDAVADCVSGGGGADVNGNSDNRRGRRVGSSHHRAPMRDDIDHRRGSDRRSMSPAPPSMPPSGLTEREMTLRAMELVQEMLNDTSTILYAQGRQHLLQQAMEDGSSIVCSRCGDMIARERWRQHAEYWCRGLNESDSHDEGEGMET